jgi:hypothetical protein
MAKLKHEKLPPGQRDDYMFVVNEETGTRFKVLHELRAATNGDPVIALSLSPVDSKGKAVRKTNDEPDIKWHTRTLTEVELSDPAFDAEAVIAGLLVQMVDEKDTELSNRARAVAISSNWGTRSFRLSPPEDTGKEA